VLRMKLSVGHRRQIPAAFRNLTGEDPHEPTSLESDGRGAGRLPHPDVTGLGG
jgi:hypothetical protein